MERGSDAGATFVMDIEEGVELEVVVLGERIVVGAVPEANIEPGVAFVGCIGVDLSLEADMVLAVASGIDMGVDGIFEDNEVGARKGDVAIAVAF